MISFVVFYAKKPSLNPYTIVSNEIRRVSAIGCCFNSSTLSYSTSVEKLEEKPNAGPNILIISPNGLSYPSNCFEMTFWIFFKNLASKFTPTPFMRLSINGSL